MGESPQSIYKGVLCGLFFVRLRFSVMRRGSQS